LHGEGSSAQMNGERSLRRSAFDMMVNSFMNQYTSAFGTLEYDNLARIAIVRLNQRKKKQVTVSDLFVYWVDMYRSKKRVDMLNLYWCFLFSRRTSSGYLSVTYYARLTRIMARLPRQRDMLTWTSMFTGTLKLKSFGNLCLLNLSKLTLTRTVPGICCYAKS
jgi:hypothetical protein